jgi:hypothetical protein
MKALALTAKQHDNSGYSVLRIYFEPDSEQAKKDMDLLALQSDKIFCIEPVDIFNSDNVIYKSNTDLPCPMCDGIGKLKYYSTNDEKVKIARELRAKGFSYRQIMSSMGYKSTHSVQNLLKK